ncbi:LOW QUALITY PROTEIN: hypothetical protein U9M48_017607 [Paspalum notatum var. saurae]|uniref:Uncharacterized protein n=1 Tax=Paspalum notatum var. saurae TaxID=547442 RepID=A0AAQ3T7T0_PASNO
MRAAQHRRACPRRTLEGAAPAAVCADEGKEAWRCGAGVRGALGTAAPDAALADEGVERAAPADAHVVEGEERPPLRRWLPRSRMMARSGAAALAAACVAEGEEARGAGYTLADDGEAREAPATARAEKGAARCGGTGGRARRTSKGTAPAAACADEGGARGRAGRRGP